MADADDLIRLALQFPGAAQYPHFDRIAFKARVTFATLASDRLTANLKLAPDEQALKCEVAPEAFSRLPNAWGAQGLDARPARAFERARVASGARNGLRPRAAETEAEVPPGLTAALPLR